MSCSESDCGQPVSARGLCRSHYSRKRRTGELPKLNLTREDRFWAKVDKSGDCWIWQGGIRNSDGYGAFKVGKKMWPAHRYSYFLANGSIPEGLVIDHSCHNPPCVNPAHLRAVTVSQNNQNKAGAMSNSSSGIRGVYWEPDRGTWRVRVGAPGRRVDGGRHSSIEQAEAAAIELRRELGFLGSESERSAA